MGWSVIVVFPGYIRLFWLLFILYEYMLVQCSKLETEQYIEHCWSDYGIDFI